MSTSLIGPPPIKEGTLSVALSEFLQAVYKICFAHVQSGTTASRPTKDLWVGRPYFDTTLNKPIWLKTVSTQVWVDATGSTV